MRNSGSLCSDICVVGGGVIGLLTAREFLLAGKQVVVVEANECGKEASWAGGGIVSPLYPWRYNDAVTALVRWAQQYYPHLCDELLRDTGIDCEFQRSGLLLLDVHDLVQAIRWSREQQRAHQLLASPDYLLIQCDISSESQNAIHFPDVAQVRNPRLVKALKADVLLRGGQIVEHAPVSNWLQQQATVVSVNAAQYQIAAEHFVVCGGAWSASILRSFDVALAVKPIRGQMLMFAPQSHALHHIVLKNGRYLIPRRDGRILCGSTVEDVGFDKSTTESAFESLLQSALNMMPSLAAHSVEMQWAGLRPGSPNGTPYIARIPDIDNLYVNAGQFRNGVVLAPASARLMSDLVLQRQAIVDPAPYAITPSPVSAICSASRES